MAAIRNDESVDKIMSKLEAMQLWQQSLDSKVRAEDIVHVVQRTDVLVTARFVDTAAAQSHFKPTDHTPQGRHPYSPRTVRSISFSHPFVLCSEGIAPDSVVRGRDYRNSPLYRATQ